MPEDNQVPTNDQNASDKNQYDVNGAVHGEGITPVSNDEPVSSTDPYKPVASSPDAEPATASVSSDSADTVPVQSYTEPAVTTPAATGLTTAAPKKSKKKFVIGGVIAGALILLCGGGALAYSMYQQPDKVVADGFVNVFKAKMTGATGTAEVSTNETKLTVDLSGKSSDDASAMTANVKVKMKTGDLSGKEFSVVADGVYVKEGTVYFRLANLDKAFDAYIDATYSSESMTDYSSQYKSYVKQMYQPIIDKINNQWLKISPDDLKDVDKDSSDDMQCATDALKKLRDDKNVSKEVSDTYKANKFIIIKEKLGTKDGSMGYVIDVDKDKSKTFGEALEKTEFGKSIKKCTDMNDSSSSDSSFDDIDSSSDDSDIKNGRFEIWVDQWSHQITHVVASGEGSGDADFNLDFKPVYNKLETINTPTDAKSIKELTKELESLSSSSSSSSSLDSREL